MKGEGKTFKCAQTGGTSGSIIPPDFLDTPMDFASMAEKGAGLGSGALLICGEDTCIVDLASVLLRFFKAESCGKCTPCRIGTTRLMETFDRLRVGKGKPEDLAVLESVAQNMFKTSFCGLGQAAPTPVLTALRFFRDEIAAHLDGHCPAGVCSMQAPPAASTTRHKYI